MPSDSRNSKGTEQEGRLLPHLSVLGLEEGGNNLEDSLLDHLIGCFLVVDQLVESLEGITDQIKFEIFNEKNLFELSDVSVKHGHSNLHNTKNN